MDTATTYLLRPNATAAAMAAGQAIRAVIGVGVIGIGVIGVAVIGVGITGVGVIPISYIDPPSTDRSHGCANIANPTNILHRCPINGL